MEEPLGEFDSNLSNETDDLKEITQTSSTQASSETSQFEDTG